MTDLYDMVKSRSMHATKPKLRKDGGRAEFGGGDKDDEPAAEGFEPGNNKVTKEALEKKKGGKVMKKEKYKEGGKIEEASVSARPDRAPRKRGGGVGSDMNPFSSAHGPGTERADRPKECESGG